MLQLSTYFSYGLRTLVILASKSGNEPVALRVLAADQGISKKYLEIIYGMMRKAGIIRGIKGVGGGYELSVPSDELTLLDVMNAVEGPLRIIDCIGDESVCNMTKRCSTQRTWIEFEDYIKSFLKSKTLKDLVDEYRESDKGFEGMFI